MCDWVGLLEVERSCAMVDSAISRLCVFIFVEIIRICFDIIGYLLLWKLYFRNDTKFLCVNHVNLIFFFTNADA